MSLLRSAYDAFEKQLTPRVEAVVQNPSFAQGTALVGQVRRAMGARVESANARLLHLVNLPASTDVQRLNRQVGDLDHEIRRLRRELAQYAEKDKGEPTDAEPAQHLGPRPTRG